MTLSMDKDARDRLREARKTISEHNAPKRKAANAESRKRAKERREALKAFKDQEASYRHERVQEPGYLAYLRRQRCCVAHLGGCGGRTDPAHIRFSDFSVGRINPGKGRKSDDRWATPLCRVHHDAQHAFGDEKRWWETVPRMDASETAQRFYAAYQAGEDGPADPQHVAPVAAFEEETR